jgi:uncharacterized protein
MHNEREPSNPIFIYLKKQHVLSLCCSFNDDIWCANCFYVFDEIKVEFYLMTSTESLHSKLMLNNNNVAGTVNGQPKNISLIKGIQYKGVVSLLTEKDNADALSLYTKRFPIAKIKSLPLWKIEISALKFTNNILGFGKKTDWYRE